MHITYEVPEEVLHQLLDPVALPRMARVHYDMPTPPPLENFPKQPVFARGPYDYHLATDAEVAED